ncbi:MAG: hypothetical protein BJ554DRAFT_3769 [Olpidium bornovanus]|uniref:Uncharacterized protein n=1 Tax=Olpidium bornovanus TaxID=278681 RepID=A0A8H8A0Q7_9FUNG|nr:MAG: hypothetical protein BJ554DRAFT_3769 [Olpidium bornovanus]
MASHDLTALQTPLDLLRMTKVPMGGTNSVGHVVATVNEVLRDHVPKVTIPFIGDLPMHGPRVEECDHTVDKVTGTRRFVVDHVDGSSFVS